MDKTERRSGGEIRATRQGDGDGFSLLAGHAAVFNRLSQDLGGFREQVAPGAFANSIDGDVRALFNHRSDIPLGRTKAGTLRLQEDDVGLAVEIDLPATRAAQDLAISVDRGDVSEMSFGFRVQKDKWERREGGGVVRTLIQVRLLDVSPVVFPAYPQTDVAVRSLEEWLEEEEALKRDPLRSSRMGMRLALADRI